MHCLLTVYIPAYVIIWGPQNLKHNFIHKIPYFGKPQFGQINLLYMAA